MPKKSLKKKKLRSAFGFKTESEKIEQYKINKEETSKVPERDPPGNYC